MSIARYTDIEDLRFLLGKSIGAENDEKTAEARRRRQDVSTGGPVSCWTS